jgi:CheY-like chemotaxis protein
MRVLIVDDDAGNRRLLTRILEHLGHESDTAADGAEAIALAAAAHYDLVLVDLQMPGVDGFEAARRLRTAARPGTRIVAQSGMAEAEVRRRLGTDGIDGYLGKPYGIPEVARVLQDTTATP